jgi:acetyltransferase-like isoleucine patch superfamily enzyme
MHILKLQWMIFLNNIIMFQITYFIAKIFKKIRFSAIKNSKIHKTSKIESGSTVYDCEIGRYSFCGYDCEIIKAKIGNFTSIANNVVIGGATHPMSWVGMSPVFYSGRDSIKKKFSNFQIETPKQTIIGNDVWIGRSAIIISGVNIGNGAVVGAGSIVTKDVPNYAIVVGNPARIIRYRFSEHTIRKLEKISWWELDDFKINEVSHTITNVDDFISALNKNDK